MPYRVTAINYDGSTDYTKVHQFSAVWYCMAKEQLVISHTQHLHTLAGTFSSVYMASVKGVPEERFAIKHLIPTSASFRIKNELKFLQMLG